MTNITDLFLWTTADDWTWTTGRAWGQIINDNFDNLNTDKLEVSEFTDANIKTKYENNADTNAYTDAEKTKLAWIESWAEANIWVEYTTTEKTKLSLIEDWAKAWDVVWPTSSIDNAIAKFDSTTGKIIQNSDIFIDDDWNILPVNIWTQELWSDTNPFKDITYEDENWLVITARKLWGLHRDYNEGASFLPFSIDCSVTSSVWTCTITDESGSWYLAFWLWDKDLRSSWPTLSVDTTAFAWTDLLPNTIYIYVQNNGSDMPELIASNTEPTWEVVQVARYKAGAVGTDSVNIYWKVDTVIEMYKIAEKVYHRAYSDWPRYESWLLQTVSATDVTIWVWQYILIFDDITTVQKQVSVDWLYYIKNDWTYNESNTFDFGWEYNDGVTIWNNKYFNVVLWVLEDDTTRIVWLAQNGTSWEYTSLDDANEDISNQTIYYPTDDLLKNIFVPVCRVIVKYSWGVYTLQELDSWLYYEDLRWIRQSGWGGIGWTSNVEDWNIESDFAVWNATTGQYEPKTIAETKTILDLSWTNTWDQDLSTYATLTWTETLTNKSIVVTDHWTATTDEVVNVCYWTSETPPTASTTTEWAIYIQYTA